ncbi:DUF262 domain-containing protein [Capnocytophaga sp. oral taxon 326]|jgi:hypothetical protein|uniref:DUF262 domain-containing protein n=1 Tax=Capnocytophaga sp. oral taxon 326 TaxID=712212 RepID=UPI0002A367F7|nr:DUF262 domain-containing protein [Capnocytophaga sp. oral taxon 326]EKY13600.1 hypothetical protein HMPREF9073_02439 [Capnocytophaga sp. oral taxon 326 str. F0382]
MENKKYTLLNFLKSEYSDAISFEIPIIQRDYAQGRSDERSKEIRKTFLGSLIAAVENYPQKNIELDFVYGKRNKNKVYLLDGQQRITTLYLLHWYLAQRLQKPSLLKDVALSYRVRQYADEFTQKISDESTQIDFTSSIPSQAICNCTWFFDAWKHDPTVKGMLNTLDTIHELLKDKKISEERYWQPLEEGAVTFYWLDLEEHHLTDELYLKMNARGKQLSNFENFKASLVKRVADNGWEENIKEKDSFSFKMDTIYTDLFWEYRGEENIIDYEVINFFAGMAMIGYALKENSEAQQKRIQELFNNPLSVRVEDFEKSNFERFTSYLDFYSPVEKISIETELWKYYNPNNKRGFFKEFIKDENKGTGEFYKGATYPQRIFFYALSELFMEAKDKNNISEDFIRVVRNIVENATIDSAQTFVYAIKLMSELLEGVQDIYWYLSKTAIQSNFASYQVTQEKQKAERIVANPEWKDAIWEAEDHPMFKGDIGFLLLETENDLPLFKKRYEVAKEMFEEKGVKGKYRENALLIRALVSRFDNWYLFWSRLVFDSSTETWKRILKTDNRWVKYFLLLLDNESKLEQFIIEDSSLQKGDEDDNDFKLRKKTHTNLYQTELLVAICEECYLRWESNNYILYPYNCRNERFKYIVTNERNKKLAQAVAKGIISTGQQLELNGKKIPFFWGWNVHFTYDDKEYVWWYNGQITQNRQDGQDCKDELLKIFE